MIRYREELSKQLKILKIPTISNMIVKIVKIVKEYGQNVQIV